MSRRRLVEFMERPFAVVLPDPDSRGRWLFYVGDVFIDDTHTARAQGGFVETNAALEGFRASASAINAAVAGLTMPDDHRAKWAVLLDAMEEKGGESLPQVARTLAVTMGVDLERLPELGPRPAPPPPPIDVRLGGRVRFVHNGHEFDAVVTDARIRPPEIRPPQVEYSALGDSPLLIPQLPDPMRMRVELELMLPTEPAAPRGRAELVEAFYSAGNMIPPDVAAELLALEPGAVLRGPQREVVLPPGGSYTGVRVTNITTSGGPGSVEVSTAGPRDDDEPTPELPSAPRSEE